MSVDPEDYPDAKCSVCNIPNCLAVELTKTDDNRFLCEKCVLDDKSSIRGRLSSAYDRLIQMEKDKEKRSQFWE